MVMEAVAKIRDICYKSSKAKRELREQLPYKPYCYFSNGYKKSKKKLVILPREQALRQRNIQLNPPHQIVFLTFDLDYGIRDNLIWKIDNTEFKYLSCFPPPMWILMNPKNGHAHLIYVLKTPVHRGKNARKKPLKYLEAIYQAMCEALGADPSYNGLTSKNPWCGHWKEISMSEYSPRPYELDELAQFVGLDRWDYVETAEERKKQRRLKKKVDEARASLGRNCATFEEVRLWSYSTVRSYWKKTPAEWLEAVRYKCSEVNAKFSRRMAQKEVMQIAKSIARWTWEKMTPDGFRTYQNYSGKKRDNKKKEEGLAMLKDGCQVKEVSKRLGVCERTVYNWKKSLTTTRDILLPEEYRGREGKKRLVETEGVSVRTYYRRIKRGNLSSESRSKQAVSVNLSCSTECLQSVKEVAERRVSKQSKSLWTEDWHNCNLYQVTARRAVAFSQSPGTQSPGTQSPGTQSPGTQSPPAYCFDSAR